MINVLAWAMMVMILVGKVHTHTGPPGPPIEGEPESLEVVSGARLEPARRLPTLLGFGPVGYAHDERDEIDPSAGTGHGSVKDSASTPTR